MWFIKKKRKREKSDDDELKLGANKQLKKLKKTRFSNDLIRNINKVFRIFLEHRYNLKQSYTYEELANKIKLKKISHQQKEHIMFLAAEINNIEYNFAKLDKKISKKLLEKLKEIINFKEK